MANLNKNTLIHQLQELVDSNIQKNYEYLPKSFNSQQLEALEIFKKRIFLESIVEESVIFNKNLNWEDKNSSVQPISSPEELMEVFKLRSDVYHDINYQNEFPDPIDTLNFDSFDKNSAIIYYKREGEITGTCRMIFDSEMKLPTEKNLCFDKQRKSHEKIGEISRNIVKNRGQGLNLEFRYLMAGMHNVFINNDINLTLSGIRKDHFKLFSKFGGIDIVHEMDNYGEVDMPFLIISWDPSQASKFFKKAFL